MKPYKYYIYHKDASDKSYPPTLLYRVNDKATQVYDFKDNKWQTIINGEMYAKWEPIQWHTLEYKSITEEEVFLELL